MLEFAEVEERRARLAELGGIEDHLFAQVDEGERIVCVADEDLERTSAEKTSAVHFVRFEFSAADIAALKGGAGLTFLIDHAGYRHQSNLSPEQRAALIADFD
jgi:hypothetical protein